MRNLQKILALVLALVMSLSLMATAGATDFTDAADIDETFATSVEVLNGLEVFKGYPTGDFQPKGEITRAEVAAIIYRIATGDVSDSQVGIYADYNKFSDVYASETYSGWAAGYINYCANAEYIKGRGDGKFYPQDKVTGYEALAMILRAVGYDKNGEFTGNDWQVQTAAIANQRGVTKNISAGLLGQAATREMVAEILCQAILLNTVNYTLAYGYQISNDPHSTLGYQKFHLEKLEGVVVANEYANFNGTSTLAADRTNFNVDGQVYTLNYGTDLDDMGESRIAYVTTNTEDSKNISKVLALGDSGKNTTTYETLDKKSNGFTAANIGATTGTGVRREEGVTEVYKNFGYEDAATSDYRIRYTLKFTSSTDPVQTATQNRQHFEATYGLNVSGLSGVGMNLVDGTNEEWTKVIAPNTTLTQDDLNLIEWIFDNADRLGTGAGNYVDGEVYVGTASLDDVSDEISYNQFRNIYLNIKEEANVTSNENGNWVKVIDNNDDGVAEYILKVVYTMAQVVRVNDSGVPTLDVAGLTNFESADKLNEITTSQTVNANDEVAAGDIVYYAKIDGKAQVYKAEKVNKDINIVDRTGLKVTTTDDTTYNQSGVHGNHVVSTDYASGVINMAGSVNYDMWLDRGGHLALFTRSAGSEYTLITDGWYRSVVNGNEYNVRAYQDGAQNIVPVNGNGNLFIGTDSSNNSWRNLKALAGNTVNTDGLIKTTVVSLGSAGILTPVDWVYANTNKTVRMINTGTSVPLMSYVSGTAYRTTNNNQQAYNQANNGVVDGANTVNVCGTSNTVYYYVYRTNNKTDSGVNVEVRTGYSNALSIDSKYIEDVYAVGTLQNRVSNLGTPGTNEDAGDRYFTADVVVVELNSGYRRGGEQVLIYNIPVAMSDVNIERVDIIREDGTKATVEIDLNNSWNYLPADGTESRIGFGLYYMYPTTTENRYTVEGMSHADIAKNNYAVGQVVTSNGTVEQNWVEVQPIYTDGTTGANIRRGLGSNSHVYNLTYSNVSGTVVRSGSLTEYDPATSSLSSFLSERVSQSNDAYADQLAANHQHDAGAGNNPRYWYNNDVLVKYSGSSVVYAVSFNNANNGTNYAQTVWNNVKASATTPDTPQEPIVVRENSDLIVDRTKTPTEIIVPYSVWFNNPSARLNSDGDFTIYFRPVNDVNNDNQIAEVNKNNWTTGELPVLFEDVTPDAEYSITLMTKGGNGAVNYWTYKVIFKAVAGDSTLSTTVAGGNNVAEVDAIARTIEVGSNGSSMNISRFIDCFKPTSDKAKLEWTFVDGKGEVDEDDYPDTTMSNVLIFTLRVIAEDDTFTDYTGVLASLPEGNEGLEAANQMKADATRYLDACGNLTENSLKAIREKVDATFDAYIAALTAGDAAKIAAAETKVDEVSALVRAASDLLGDTEIAETLTKGKTNGNMISDADMVAKITTYLTTHPDLDVDMTSLKIKGGSVVADADHSGSAGHTDDDGVEWGIHGATWEAVLKCGSSEIVITWNWSAGDLTYEQNVQIFHWETGDYVTGGNTSGMNAGGFKYSDMTPPLTVGEVYTTADHEVDLA